MTSVKASRPQHSANGEESPEPSRKRRLVEERLEVLFTHSTNSMIVCKTGFLTLEGFAQFSLGRLSRKNCVTIYMRSFSWTENECKRKHVSKKGVSAKRAMHFYLAQLLLYINQAMFGIMYHTSCRISFLASCSYLCPHFPSRMPLPFVSSLHSFPSLLSLVPASAFSRSAHFLIFNPICFCLSLYLPSCLCFHRQSSSTLPFPFFFLPFCLLPSLHPFLFLPVLLLPALLCLSFVAPAK